MANSKADSLVKYLDRWLGASGRRNLQLLSKQSGVPYQTLRRLVQRESEPSQETAMTILNIVASLEETLDYFGDSEAVSSFYRKIANSVSLASPELMSRFLDKDGFWTLMLAFTIGATRDRVEKLLGTLGVAEFEEMISEGYLTEKSPGLYSAGTDQAILYIENKRLAHEAVIHIAQMHSIDEPMERFLVYNVSVDGYRKMRLKLAEVYQETDLIAREHEGDIMVAFSLVGKQVASSVGGSDESV